MKTLDEIKSTRFLTISQEYPNAGIVGDYVPIEYGSKGAIKTGQRYHFIFSWDNGWEHLSITLPYKNKTLTWEEMCMMKDIFFRDDEDCVQYHPRKEDYVNAHPYCLHIWRPINQELPLPDKRLVY